ncbi:nucleosome assembly protein 1-like 1 [Periplaneta americana]|uniref:nucleosome assembly protein 1-like 1 n=1 Tax=Periplaneta americana TaxID=6978 RepID=UPI0037E802E9
MADPERVGDAADEVEEMEEEEEQTGVDGFTNQVLRRPDVLAALQGRLHAEMLEHLPASVKRRIKALKKIQLEATNIEAKFYEEVHLLECKYQKLYVPLYEKRGDVISGLYEPTDLECEWESDDEKEEELRADMKNKVKIEDVDAKKEDNEINKNDETKGIPNFWLTIFKNVQMLSEMVQEHDEPILKHLYDIKVIFLESNPMGFVLEFHFSPNEYFSNSVLTKEYEMKCTPDEGDPFSFEGPEIYKCKGCIIDWKKGKNVTVKTIKKKQKHKSRGSVRTVTKTVQNDSFFNFFSPPCMPEDPEAEMDEETQALLTSDFEIGHYIRERIVPRAILYYTGEALEDEDFEEEEEGEEGEEEEDDDDAEFNPANNRQAAPKNMNPADCKQQ